jgi:FKBP-type peptidyl-prolyl cis-trans isomerase
MDGTEFDASYNRNQPFSFKLGVGQVIRCWDFAIARMSTGQKVKVTCPSDWAYGSRGAGGLIPPNADLIFEVELLSFK